MARAGLILLLQVWAKTGQSTFLLSLDEKKTEMDKFLITTNLFNYLLLWLLQLLE